jgi:hypothetical protein
MESINPVILKIYSFVRYRHLVAVLFLSAGLCVLPAYIMGSFSK